MRWSPLVALLVTVPALAQIGPNRRDARSSPPQTAAVEAPPCVAVRATSRMDGVGYTHAIVVENHCTGPVVCDVGTDAGEAPAHIVVAAGASSETVVRLASPAPGVAARGRCRESAR